MGRNESIKLNVYTLCWNEIEILPFVIDYWEKMGVNHVTVYDNGSTDGSKEYLGKYNDWITIIDNNDENFDDIRNANIKNNCWKDCPQDVDFVWVCDFDEVPYSIDIQSQLTNMKEGGYTVYKPNFVETFTKEPIKYSNNKLLHEQCMLFNHGYDGGKYLLFDPHEVKEMNFSVGSHIANPVGNIKEYRNNKSIACIHCKNVSGVHGKIKRNKELQERLSIRNKQCGFGIHYSFSQEKVEKEYEEKLKETFICGDNNLMEFL